MSGRRGGAFTVFLICTVGELEKGLQGKGEEGEVDAWTFLCLGKAGSSAAEIRFTWFYLGRPAAP